MRQTFELFAKLLDERLAAAVPTKEDSVRYTFFYALLSSTAYKHTEVIVEHRHPVIVNREIDFLVIPQDNSPSIALEFKYDHTIPSGRNLNKTERAGRFFNDLLRLAHVPRSTATRKFFVYVTDAQMASYFRNPDNEFADLFDLPTGKDLQVGGEFLDGRPASFCGQVLCDFIPLKAIGAYACGLSEKHLLRVWEIVA